MTQDFAQRFVHLSRSGLASNLLAKLSLYHAECGFDI